MRVADKLTAAISAERSTDMQTLLTVLKSDLYMLLTEYATDADADSFTAAAEAGEDGIRITLSATVGQIRSVGKLLPEKE